MKKIVITGTGAVTPLGMGVENHWQALIAGQDGIGEITRIPTAKLPIHRAAEVKNFNAKDYLSSRLRAEMDIFTQFAYIAAEEALKESNLEIVPERTGIVMGTAVGGINFIGQTQEDLAVLDKPVEPRFLSRSLGNIAAALLSISYQIQGPSLTVSTACSSGGDAIITGAMLLEAGIVDAVVVMGGETAISPLFIHSLCRAGAISRTMHSSPFSKDRDGFVIGEGGGAVILETEERALARQAAIKGELIGWKNNLDAFHPVSPHPEGAGAAACMRGSLQKAQLSPQDIDYVNAHGTATIKGDLAESKALQSVFGEYRVPISSTKGATGHMMAAGGITELITCLKVIETGIMPPNLNYHEKDPECDLNIVANQAQKKEVKIAMSNSFGFGGQNSSLIVRKYN